MNNITEITEMMAELVKSHLDEDVTLTAIEQATRVVMQEVGRQTVEMTLKTMNSPYPEPVITCGCDAEADYVRQRTAYLHAYSGENDH
ncbi:MAG: hypothetical protein IAF02_14245 [Anaerolineae bacterium]|nr:hypothetical protein [Anaerolineae bacterium]